MNEKQKFYLPYEVVRILQEKKVKAIVEPSTPNGIFKNLKNRVLESKSVVKPTVNESIFTKLKKHVMEARQTK